MNGKGFKFVCPECKSIYFFIPGDEKKLEGKPYLCSCGATMKKESDKQYDIMKISEKNKIKK